MSISGCIAVDGVTRAALGIRAHESVKRLGFGVVEACQAFCETGQLGVIWHTSSSGILEDRFHVPRLVLLLPPEEGAQWDLQIHASF